MLNRWEDELMAKERCLRLLRAYEEICRYRQIRAGQGKRGRLLFLVLVWLGGHMVNWGRSLQERYSAQIVPGTYLHQVDRTVR